MDICWHVPENEAETWPRYRKPGIPLHITRTFRQASVCKKIEDWFRYTYEHISLLFLHIRRQILTLSPMYRTMYLAKHASVLGSLYRLPFLRNSRKVFEIIDLRQNCTRNNANVDTCTCNTCWQMFYM